MQNNIIDVYVVICDTEGFGEREKPIGYYSDYDKAVNSITANSYARVKRDTVKAIQVDDRFFLLGDEIDLDKSRTNKEKDLANRAMSKLSSEERNAIRKLFSASCLASTII